MPSIYEWTDFRWREAVYAREIPRKGHLPLVRISDVWQLRGEREQGALFSKTVGEATYYLWVFAFSHAKYDHVVAALKNGAITITAFAFNDKEFILVPE